MVHEAQKYISKQSIKKVLDSKENLSNEMLKKLFSLNLELKK
jgi:hypothetical protein